MDIWCAAGQTGEPGLAALISRAAERACPLVRRDLPAGPAAPGVPNCTGPILIWQEQNDSRARAHAFTAGVDEVIGPWMDPEEALARLLRYACAEGRGRSPQQLRMILGELDIDLVDRTARRGNRPLDLLRREYELLVHLARHCGRVQSREALLQAIWRLAFDPGTNVVQVHVSRLRAKLDRGFARPMLHTIRGAGYCLVTDG